MRWNSSRLVAVMTTLLLAACAGLPAHEALPDGARDRITSTEVVAPIRQSEIYVFVPTSTAGAANGLIGALVDVTVDSIRTSKAEAAVKPLRDALVDFDFDGTLQSELKASLSQKSWMRVQNVRVVKDVNSDSLDRALAGSKADAVLFAQTDYRLSNNADVLSIWLTATLYPNNDALRALKPQGSGNPKTNMKISLYRNVLLFQARAPGATDDRAHNIPIWSAQGGAQMRAALKLGAAKLSQMLGDDIEQKSQPDASSSAMSTYSIQTSLDFPLNEKGRPIANDASGTIVRLEDGSLAFLMSEAPQPVAQKQ